MIHSSAIVESDRISPEADVGPYVVIGKDVVLEAGVKVHPHVTIAEGVHVGRDTEIFPGAFLGKEPKGAGATARTPTFDRSLVIGEGCSIGPHVTLYCGSSIGRQTLVGDGSSIREGCRIGDHCLIGRCVTINYNTSVGNGTKIMDMSHLTGNSVVGEGVFVSVHVGMANDKKIGKDGYSEDRVRGPILEDGSAVGLGAQLMPGVRIGRGAMVSAQSLVSRDVAPFTVVAGMPARLVRELEHD